MLNGAAGGAAWLTGTGSVRVISNGQKQQRSRRRPRAIAPGISPVIVNRANYPAVSPVFRKGEAWGYNTAIRDGLVASPADGMDSISMARTEHPHRRQIGSNSPAGLVIPTQH